MINRIREHLQEIKIKRTLRKATKDLSAAKLTFEAFEKKYVKTSNDQKKLLTYCILIAAGNQTSMRSAKRFNAVLREYAESLELAISLKSLGLAILLQKECARERFERDYRNDPFLLD